ncbi:MAG TPA: thiamine diphosphokinase [Spirochaetia bacterium]|nr:thiamine diphosphokinase [Spirochaetia bacterium]
MRGILFTGGECPRPEAVTQWLQGASIIVAADSGYDNAKLFALEPDLVVGDMDSIGDREKLKLLPADRVAVYPEEKDWTDTELGLTALFDRGVEEVVIVGGGGGRLDHLFGIFALFDRARAPLLWLLPGAEVHCIEARWRQSGLAGATISFFPAGAETCRMRSSGLKWSLDGLEWKRGDAGISNVAIDDCVEIEMLSGRLVMVRSVEG